MEYVIAAVMGYFCGCMPVSALTARRYGVDLHATGDATREPGTRSSSSAPGARGRRSSATA